MPLISALKRQRQVVYCEWEARYSYKVRFSQINKYKAYFLKNFPILVFMRWEKDHEFEANSTTLAIQKQRFKKKNMPLKRQTNNKMRTKIIRNFQTMRIEIKKQ